MRRSEDGGGSWGPLITVADPGFHGGGVTIDDIHVLDVMRLDYLLHVLLFIPLVPLSRMSWPGRPWWLIITAGLLFAACSEFLHLLLPYRGYNINDLFANMAGVIEGAFLSLIVKLK